MIRARRRGTALAGLAALALLVFVALVPEARALVVAERDFPNLVDDADIILIGRVAALRSEWDPLGTTIFTHATLEDLEVIKGRVGASPWTVRVPGGVVGDRAQAYPGMPRLKTGRRYVLFVRDGQPRFLPFVGGSQGVFEILHVDGEDVVEMTQTGSPEALGSRRGPEQVPLEAFQNRIRARLDARR